MAIERKQRLINLHTSAMTTEKQADLLSALSFGEIAVAHGASATSIFTKAQYTGELNPKLAEFIDKEAVKALINAEGVEGLKSRVSALELKHVSGKTVADEVTDGINTLDATIAQTAGTDGFAITIVEENGKLTSVNASIAANTYDAYGAANTVKDEIVASASTDYNTLKKLEGKIKDEAATRKSADDALQGNIDAIYKSGTTESGVLIDKIAALDATVSGQNASEQIKVEVVEADGVLTNVTVTAGKFDVDGAASSAKTEVIGQSGDAWATKKTLWAVHQEVADEAVRAKGAEDTISGDVNTLTSQLVGIPQEEGAVKSYVDGKVVGLLHFKGTKDTIQELPDIASTSVTHGDVWNIVNEFTYEEKVYPAGTNVVAIKLSGETPYWDALGGTVDLAPYAKKQETTADTKDTMSVAGAKKYADSLDAAMGSRVDTVSGDVASLKTAVETLTGDTGVTGSVKQQIKAATDVIDAYTVNGIKISTNPVLDGADIKLDGYAKASAAAAIATADTVNAALGKLEFKLDNNITATTKNAGDITALDTSVKANTAAIALLNSGETVEGSVDYKVKTAIDALDATVSGQNTSGQIKVEVVEANGVLTNVTVTADKFDADGAAATALTSAKTYTDSKDTAMNSRVVLLEAAHATAETGYKTVKAEAEGAIAAIASHAETSSSCGATASVTTAAGSVSAVAIDMTELTINCGEF